MGIVGIDLFSGAGGMSLGALDSGIDLRMAVERCPHAAGTYRLNFPKVPVHIGEIKDLLELPPKPEEGTTVVFGGPPCQGFSTSNQRTRSAKNPNNWLFQEFVRVVTLWHPDWVVMENVKGITETEGGRFLDATVAALSKAGYTVSYEALNAAGYSVPQRRTRLFIVASLHGVTFRFPTPDNQPAISVGDALGDLPELANGAAVDELPYGRPATADFAQRMRNGSASVTGNLVTRNAPNIMARYEHVPQGGNWADIPAELMDTYREASRCHTGIYRRLDPKTPASVIGNFRKNMLIHPFEDRGLSVREAARLQGVTDSFRFQGSIGFQQQQVGNMVPPPLAARVFESLAAQ